MPPVRWVHWVSAMNTLLKTLPILALLPLACSQGDIGDGFSTTYSSYTGSNTYGSTTYTDGDTVDTGDEIGTDAGQMCGDGAATGSEVCDGGDLKGHDCVSEGYSGGSLVCNATCDGFDTSSCTSDTCGNGTIEGNEVCDGNNLNGQTCVSQGFDGGNLACGPNCTAFDTSGCSNSTCGNGIIDPGEVCDGIALNGQTCISQGYAGGTIMCAADCKSLNTAGCVNAICGNGMIEAGETCDGAALNGQSCVSQGFSGGTLACNANCSGYNTAGCVSGSGDCCTANLYPGCQVASIQNCVCALDSFCCSNEWDSLCAQEAVDYCGAIC